MELTKYSTFTVFGHQVKLEAFAGVFMPSSNGLFYARSIRIAPGERVIDIGTGSGVLAIAAAKNGGRVSATDIDPRAVTAAGNNALINNVEIDVRRGELFADFEGTFDVILANLPNEIVAPSYISDHPQDDVRTFDGGNAGNEHVLNLLNSAHQFMSPESRLYLGVHSLTDYHATFRTAISNYSTRLVDLEELPAKPFVTDNLSFYQALDEAGVVKIFRNAEGQWCTYGYICELSLFPATA
ncbi:MAG: 50S ribosomal protein L11 methyltransferase [Balneolaceae bacterium]